MADIKDKIRKLLALSRDESASSGEIDVALRKAAELMAREGLTEEEVIGYQPKMGQTLLGIFNEGYFNHIQFICGAVQALCGVKVVYYQHEESVFIAMGHETNRINAKEVWEYLLDQVNQQYKLHLPPNLSYYERSQFRKSFKISCAVSIAKKVAKITREIPIVTSSGTDLVLSQYHDQKLKEVDEWLNTQGIEIGEEKYSDPAVTDMRAAYSGYKAGESIHIRRPIDEK